MAHADLVEAVKAHALANYETGGWDFVVECWEDADIAEEIANAGATTEAEAIAAVARFASLQDERRREVEATVW